jgi:hypothetical protein
MKDLEQQARDFAEKWLGDPDPVKGLSVEQVLRVGEVMASALRRAEQDLVDWRRQGIALRGESEEGVQRGIQGCIPHRQGIDYTEKVARECLHAFIAWDKLKEGASLSTEQPKPLTPEQYKALSDRIIEEHRKYAGRMPPGEWAEVAARKVVGQLREFSSLSTEGGEPVSDAPQDRRLPPEFHDLVEVTTAIDKLDVVFVHCKGGEGFTMPSSSLGLLHKVFDAMRDVIWAMKVSPHPVPDVERPVQLSRDYEALYEHLCNGGEALGKVWAPGLNGEPECYPAVVYRRGEKHLSFEYSESWIQRPMIASEFIAECQRLDLEWVAVKSSLPKKEG